MNRRVVIGVGNPLRGDDGAGRRAAALLRAASPPDVEIIGRDGEATALLEAMDGAELAIFIDACASGAAPGAVRRFDVARAPLPQNEFGASSHGLGLATAIELARALGGLPRVCVVYAIEGESFTQGAPLSRAAEAGAIEAARLALAELRAS
ncbi:hydrogenase maturation protease [Methylosinus sp. Sm6]|uniref:hydrogenase maturation protease n=1 Tax=Methylosinus sp. Sm6 TaxID=2866948 RepID=UPI001C99BDC3|nr:hydrogenase maturation protease [Methylosinus sp. Sm6]MBY6241452.1 hydrogenase maturation protease [Methylosinus sp. Sm6]